MNKQIFTVNSQKIVFSLLAIATLGFTPLSAKANDKAIIQESFQDAYTSGVGNVSVQNSRQLNRENNDYRGRHGAYRRKSNIGVVQRSQQLCDQVGEENVCVQDAEQRNSSRTRRSRW